MPDVTRRLASTRHPMRRPATHSARTVGTIAWFAFLVAGAFTTALFIFLGPTELPPQPSWWNGHRAIYTILFFCSWSAAVLLWIVAMYLSRREHE
jgi:hypothetical protein